MTVATSTSRSGPYAGAGQFGPFVIDFRFLADSHLKVIKTDSAGIETTLTLGTNYTVGGAGSLSGGSLTLTAALAAGYTLTIQRNVPLTQLADYTQSDSFPAESHENALDKACMIDQQLQDGVNRSIRVPEVGVVLPTLPAVASRANQLMAFDALGNPTTAGPSSGGSTQLALDLANNTLAAKGGALVGWSGSLSYPAGTVGKKLKDLESAVGGGNGVSMVAAGADGTGVVDCNAVLAAVFAALPAGGMIVFDAGKTFKLSTALLNGKACTIMADGATINCTLSTGALNKTDHGNKLTVVGGNWVGTGTAVPLRYEAAPSASTYVDLVVSRAKFNTASGYGVYLVGTREALFSQCEFTSSVTGGVYLNQANNPYFSQCVFIGQGAGIGFNADGGGSPNSANPILRDCESMGWNINVKIVGCDDFHMDGCTVDYGIAYNTYISSQDGGSIRGCYLGSNNANPAVVLTSEGNMGWAPDNCQKISISDCSFTGHYTGGFTYDNLLLTGDVAARYPTEISIQGNHFQFYTRYGINFSTTDRVSIIDNDFDPRAGFGRIAISNLGGGGDSTTIIAHNRFPPGTDLSPAALWGANLSFCNVFNNIGYLGQNTASVNGGANSINMQANGNAGVGGAGSSYWHWINATGAVRLDRYANTPTFRFRRAGGNITAPATVGAADAAGNFTFDAAYWDGTVSVFSPVAGITATTNGVQSATSSPGMLDFQVTPSYGAVGSVTTALRIAQDRLSINAAGTLNAPRPALLFHGDSLTATTGIFSGPGAPTATAAKGSLYLRTDGGAATTLYVNEAGTNVWVAK